MIPTSVVLTSLTLSSLLLGGALLLAWARFGREQHAALWAAGFFASAGAHAAGLVRALWMTDSAVPAVIGADCLLGSAALLSLGFRVRAGRVRRGGWLVAATVLAATLCTVLTLWLPAPRLQRPIGAGFIAAMLVIAALAVRRTPGNQRSANALAFWLLLGFSFYLAALAGVAAAASAGLAGSAETYRYLFLAGVPTGMNGIGLGTLLLLAGDLAERLHGLAEIDPLTGVLNRRGVERAAARLLAQAHRTRRPLSVVVADLDRFKAINDSFGHAFGDTVLKRFATHAAQLVRAGDLVGRLGGEEFVFVLADTGVGQAADAMNRLRATLSGAARDGVALTASFGITELAGRADTLDALVARADEALYRSKDEGRDRVSFAPPAPAPPADTRVPRAWRDLARSSAGS